jgi:hypothetical protein
MPVRLVGYQLPEGPPKPQQDLIEQAPFPEFTGLFPLKWSFWTSIGTDLLFFTLR